MNYSENRTTLISIPKTKTISTSITINGKASDVWSIAGDFTRFDKFVNGLDKIEMIGSGVRSIRKKLFADGNLVLEQLNDHDDKNMLMNWTLIYTSMDIGNLWSSMRVNPIDDTTCEAIWDIAAEPWSKETNQTEFEAFLAEFASNSLSNIKKLIEQKY